jgi:NAD(P)-dependent dehydrogenase (short-subunit alcohol dehydrogenase family)
LATIKPAADVFKAKESRLDTLTNNAGVMNTPPSMKTVQGYELQLGTNCVGPWLFTQHMLPILQKTAAEAPKDSVRVTWAASLAAWYAPRDGVAFDSKTLAPEIGRIKAINYGQSKAGNILLASEFAKRYGNDGIVSVSWNPGNLSTELQRHTSVFVTTPMKLMLHPAKFGAYTELWAACSPDVNKKVNGTFIAPWGRLYEPRKDILKATKDKGEGGTGVAKQFWEWCDKETKVFQA